MAQLVHTVPLAAPALLRGAAAQSHRCHRAPPPVRLDRPLCRCASVLACRPHTAMQPCADDLLAASPVSEAQYPSASQHRAAQVPVMPSPCSCNVLHEIAGWVLPAGLVFFNIPDGPASAFQRACVMFFTMLLFELLPFCYVSFYSWDRKFFLADRVSGTYATSAYFTAHMLAGKLFSSGAFCLAPLCMMTSCSPCHAAVFCVTPPWSTASLAPVPPQSTARATSLLEILLGLFTTLCWHASLMPKLWAPL